MGQHSHTPGPWEVQPKQSNRGESNVICDMHGNILAEMPKGFPVDELNTRLISAAPDLLEACDRALPWIGKMIADGGHKNGVLPNCCIRAMQMMESAIEKATAK